MTIPRIYTRLQAQHQHFLNVEGPAMYLTIYSFFVFQTNNFHTEFS